MTIGSQSDIDGLQRIGQLVARVREEMLAAAEFFTQADFEPDRIKRGRRKGDELQLGAAEFECAGGSVGRQEQGHGSALSADECREFTV